MTVFVSPRGSKHLLGQQLRHLFAGCLLQRQPEQHVVGVRVVPIGSGLVEQRLGDGVLQNLVDGPASERIGVQRVVHLGVADDVIDVARRHLGQLTQGHPVGVGYLGQELRQLVVEAHLLLVDELEQQRGDVGDGDRAVAKVHIGSCGHARHRLAHGLGDDLLPVDRDTDDDRLQVLGRHRVAHRPHHRIGLGRVGVGLVEGGSPGRAPGAQPVRDKGAKRHEQAPDEGHAPDLRRAHVDFA